MNDAQKLLEELLDEAVSEGRCNWDGYYGGDNSYHLNTIREMDKYKQLMRLLEQT